MSTVIPFAGQIESSERDQWIEAINASTELFTVTPIDNLVKTDKNNTEVAIVANPDPSQLDGLPQLKWLQSLWAGVDTLLASELKSNIKIVRLTDPQMAETMSEAVLAWCLYLHRKMPAYNELQKSREWRTLPLDMPQQCRISIFGLGKLGARAAQRLQQNNFTVQGWSRSLKSIDNVQTFAGEDGLQQILPLTDIAVILLPRTTNTENMFDASLLQQLPYGASLINFARGHLIVDDDLLNSLDSGQLDHAVLDVFRHEPLPEQHRFWDHTAITVLPHISAPTTIETAAKLAASNIDQYLLKGLIPDSVSRDRGY